MKDFLDKGYLPCFQLYDELSQEYNGIEDLHLASFKCFKESNKSRIVQDAIECLEKCIEKNFHEMFFHYFVIHTLSEINVEGAEIKKDMSPRFTFEILKKALQELKKNYNQEKISYVKLSQFLQMSFYIRSESNSNKLRAYNIEFSPYKIYILEIAKKIYILEPFDFNTEWRGEIPDSKLITTAYIEWLEQNTPERSCEKCGKTSKFISCIKFHKQCIHCLKSHICTDCGKGDWILRYYYS